MRIILVMLFLTTSSFANSEQLELNCKFYNYKGINRTYSQNLIKSWSPEIQTHIINTDKTAYWNEVRIEGKVKVNDSKKVKFMYELKRKYVTRWHIVYFKTTKKASIDMEFPGYIAPGSIWGTCEETKSNYKQSSNSSNSNDDNKDKINSTEKTLNKTEKAEKKCKELGFTPATENFGNCVLKLMD